MATVTSEVAAEIEVLTTLVRRMFPHASFPDAPYERCAAAIHAAGDDDPRLRAQLGQGIRELQARGFADLSEDDALALLREISGTVFFQAVRAKTVTTLYDDREVWALLGYEGASYDQGGYLERGFADLDWLPAARIEEAS
ncbi:hypothetical protein FSW04_06925 [Baekduia soli]|uniref:Gluconate 2-dehydrogenase subunit 3 family protein n=1 Tax=Baekduia soli TaxID=496014 RepID=A0A5B8U334_9ACTN|nr:hypothetical protein [Baekduia soli]QEC47341.1 hypothetical protein FSW04_06925 [Baekduia soli]